MLMAGQPIPRNARVELRTWYFVSLAPRLRDAASAGIVSPAAADALDRDVRDLLGLPRGAGDQAA